jgi:surface polysaccharide O-acyltransferase-like enzyme
VFVVVIHTTHWPQGSPLYDTLDTLSRFAVPAFMLLTGVLLSYQYGGSRRMPAVDFLRRRFSRSLVPWLAWAPVYAVFGWYFSTEPAHSLAGIGSFISYGGGHLWFLLLIPQMYFVFLAWPRRNLWWWAAAAMALQTALCVYRLYGPMPAGFVEQFFLWHGFQLLPFWIGYFAVGVALGRSLTTRTEPGHVHWAALAGALLLTVLAGWSLVAVTYAGAAHAAFVQGTGGFLIPQEPVYVLGIAAAAWFGGGPLLRASQPAAALTRVLSNNSLGIYILHPILVYFIGKRITSILFVGLPTSVLGFLTLTVAALVTATVVSALLTRTPLAPTLGARRRPPRPPTPGTPLAPAAA